MARFGVRRVAVLAASLVLAIAAVPVPTSGAGLTGRSAPPAATESPVVYGALAVDTGHSHTCAVRTDSTVVCWGSNVYGEGVAPPGTYKAVSSGGFHNCALKIDGTAACWGNPTGVGTPPAGTFVALSAGGQHNCAIKTDGSMACWGADNAGQATPLPGTFTAVSAGALFSCAIRSVQTLACWGDDTQGQASPPPGSFKAVAAAALHACAIKTDGTLTCWGNQSDGRATPPTGTYIALSAGGSHTCALRTNKTLACWGLNGDGQASPPAGTFDGLSADANHACGLTTDGWVRCWGDYFGFQPLPPGLTPIASVSSGWYHSCSVDQPEGDAKCWGDGDFGATTMPAGTYLAISAAQGFTCAIRIDETLDCWGVNSVGQTNAPTGTFSVVSAGGNHACAVRTTGALACWGYNAYGQSSPPIGTFIDVGAGFRHSCATRTNGTIACWGSNEDGQSNPPGGTFSQVSTGFHHTCGLRTDGYPVCWGLDLDGQASPPDNVFTRVSAGLYHSCGLMVDRTIFCWGYNGDGQAKPPVAAYMDVSAGGWHSCGIRTDRTPVCWGWNYYNQATTSEPAASTYVPVAPTRLLDSRSGNGLSGKFIANVARTFQIAGRGPVPANAVAVTGNFTVTRQTSGGFASVTPVATNAPSTSTINFPRGDNRANNVTVVLGPGGKLAAVYKAGAGQTTDFVFDITGYFLANETGATYTPATPVRLLDTRAANGLNGTFKARTPRTWQITGRGGIPSGATAITGNLTVTRQTSAGFVTVGPTATANPSTSTLNFPLGDTRANGLTVKLGANGTLSAVYMAGVGTATHLVLDVTGYYMADLNGTRFYPLAPDRVLDTRYGIGLDGTFKANTARTLTVAARVGVPADAVAVTGNLTVTGQTQGGFVSMTQATTNAPTTSTLNFPKGDTRANGVTGPLSGSGTVGLVERAGTGASTHLILDITGYFSDPSSSGSASTSIPGASPERGSGRIGDERNGTWGPSPRDWQH